MKPEYLEWNKHPAKPTVNLNTAWACANPYHSGRPTIRQLNREQWLAGMARTYNWTQGAELGVSRGRTFLFLLETCPNLKLIGVDLWEVQTGTLETYDHRDNNEYEQYVRNNAMKFGGRAIILKGYTNDAARQIETNSLDFVFIDADHSSEGVCSDINNWSSKIKDTGWIIGHDINWPTVKSVVDELVPGYVIGPDNVWARQKVVL